MTTDPQRPWTVEAIAAWVALPHDIACAVLAAMGYDPAQQNIEPHRLRIALDALANDGARTFQRDENSRVTIQHCAPTQVLLRDTGIRH